MSDCQATILASQQSLPDYAEEHWYAARTCSRREKHAAKILGQRGIESFLPLYQSRIRPRNGGPPASLPLFTGYVFVHIPLCQRLRVLQVPGIVNLVSFHGQPAPVGDQEIETMRNAFKAGLIAKPHPYCEVGELVEIRSGPFQGLRGKVLRKNSRYRIVLSLHILMRSVVAEIEESEVVPTISKYRGLAVAALAHVLFVMANSIAGFDWWGFDTL